MTILLLKLVLTPLLVGGSTLVARRWGPVAGGRLVALPFSSGPVLAFLAVEQGPSFASAAAVGSLAGLVTIALFCLGYARAAHRLGAAGSLAVATAVLVASAWLLAPLAGTSVWLVAAAVVAAIAAVTWLVPISRLVHPRVPYPRWDVPVRMVVATLLVLAITAVAPVLGPAWSGLIATFPVYLGVLAVFTHQHAGPVAATDVLRGLLAGLYGTTAYFVVFHAAVVPLGLAVAIGGAAAAAIGIQALALGIGRRTLRASRRA